MIAKQAKKIGQLELDNRVDYFIDSVSSQLIKAAPSSQLAEIVMREWDRERREIGSVGRLINTQEKAQAAVKMLDKATELAPVFFEKYKLYESMHTAESFTDRFSVTIKNFYENISSSNKFRLVAKLFSLAGAIGAGYGAGYLEVTTINPRGLGLLLVPATELVALAVCYYGSSFAMDKLKIPKRNREFKPLPDYALLMYKEKNDFESAMKTAFKSALGEGKYSS